jgi:hypothetical protein
MLDYYGDALIIIDENLRIHDNNKMTKILKLRHLFQTRDFNKVTRWGFEAEDIISNMVRLEDGKEYTQGYLDQLKEIRCKINNFISGVDWSHALKLVIF